MNGPGTTGPGATNPANATNGASQAKGNQPQAGATSTNSPGDGPNSVQASLAAGAQAPQLPPSQSLVGPSALSSANIPVYTTHNGPLPQQLATVLVPASQQADGSYQVTILLQPQQLGTVHVTLHLEAGTVNLAMHAEGGATGDLLKQNMNQLRDQLAAAGLSTGSLQVTTGGPGGNPANSNPGEQRPPSPPSGQSGDQPLEAGQKLVTQTRAGRLEPNAGLLDMRL